MPMVVAGFEWGDGNREKCRKHGVSIAEIEGLLRGDPKVAPDIEHSDTEQRLIAVGWTDAGRALFVAFILRQKGGMMLLRPVGARYMHKKEIETYEKKSS